MAEHFENLKAGDWVVVTGHRHHDEVDDSEPQVEYSMFGMPSMSRKQKPEYSGMPVRIMAVAFPFICVANGQQPTHALDMRVFRVNKVSLKYAKAMLNGAKQNQQQQNSAWTAQRATTTITDVAANFNLPELKDICSTEGNVTLQYPKLCPCCQESEMKETLTEGEREWKMTCESCGFTGTRPNKKRGQDDSQDNN